MGTTEILHTLTMTLCLLGKCWLLLAGEVEKLYAMLDALTHQHAGRLCEQFGVGPQTAAMLLSTAGDNPERLRNEASLAALCGVNPLPASSGNTIQHRLTRGGNRAANNALWTMAMVQMRGDPQTQSYVARRSAQGLSSKEIQRCLKRYIVRELDPFILAD
ncbi:transposase [Aeromonas veronii]|uniref:transposase n=1 Tax=Aeromonas veronii TaxID=654 RepID=UPI003B9FBE36